MAAAVAQTVEEKAKTETKAVELINPQPAKMMKFRIDYGCHVVGRKKEKDGTRSGEIKVYKQGEIVESTEDLTKHNSRHPGNPKKFVRVYDDGSTDYSGPAPAVDPFAQRKGESAADYGKRMAETAKLFAEKAEAATARDKELEKMNVAQLRKFAEGEEIDLKGAVDKDAILKIIRGQGV